MDNHRKIILIILCSVVALLIVLAVLTYIPLTRTLDYDLYGYIIRPDGQIVEEFTFTVTGKEYDFIIDPPGGAIYFQGTKLTQLERDAFILYFDWDSARITEKYTSGNYIGDYYSADPRYVLGSLSYYNGAANSSGFGTGMLNLEEESFCIYADGIVENAYILGVSDPDADPMAVLEPYLQFIKIPDSQSDPEN